MTPLHHAVQCKNKEIWLALLKRGADVRIVDDSGRTPFGSE